MSDVIPYEDLSDDQLSMMFTNYWLAARPQGFKLPRQMMIAELERMSEWLTAKEAEKVYQSMNGGRQL